LSTKKKYNLGLFDFSYFIVYSCSTRPPSPFSNTPEHQSKKSNEKGVGANAESFEES
jgi:hypothetical protein